MMIKTTIVTPLTESIEPGVTKPALEELLAPVRADFEKTGMTSDEITDFGRELLNAVRLDRKAKAG